MDPNDPYHANLRAALSVALQGLLRSAEFTSTNGGFEVDRTIRRSDIVELTDDRLVIMMAPCKNMKHLVGRTCPLVIGSGGEYIWSL